MPDSDTLAPSAPDIPTYARVLPVVSLCSSILFSVISVVTWIGLLTINSYDVLIFIFIGLPVSLFGSFFLAFLPALVLRFFVNDRQVFWSLWSSGVSVTISGGVWILIASLFRQ